MGKGELNNKISAHFFQLLAKNGVPNHFVSLESDTEQLVKHLQIIPIEVIVRNIAAGSLAKRLGLEEGTPMKKTVLEYSYKNDDLGDPMINDYHIAAMEYATKEQMDFIAATALKVNQVLLAYLKDKKIDLVDFKLEFGLHKGEVLLGDEISPDTCRFWDSDTKQKLDKDRFRRDLGDVEDAYKEIYRRPAGQLTKGRGDAARGRIRWTEQLIIDDKPKDECGVFGIYGRNLDVANITYYGLYALQHRGQESAGISVSDGSKFELHKAMGLVSEVFSEQVLKGMTGHIAIGHVRYSTTGSSLVANAQPLNFRYLKGLISLAHNGNLTNAGEIRHRLGVNGSVFQTTTTAR